jgi:hypothetical protein
MLRLEKRVKIPIEGGQMKKRMFLKPVSTITALATLALFSLFPMNTGTTQEAIGPCPKPYIKVVSPRAGLPGDRIVIRGHRFGTEPGEVFFTPRVEGEVVGWTNSKIRVIVPQSAISGNVTVSAPCGTVSNTNYFKVVE